MLQHPPPMITGPNVQILLMIVNECDALTRSAPRRRAGCRARFQPADRRLSVGVTDQEARPGVSAPGRPPRPPAGRTHQRGRWRPWRPVASGGCATGAKQLVLHGGRQLRRKRNLRVPQNNQGCNGPDREDHRCGTGLHFPVVTWFHHSYVDIAGHACGRGSNCNSTVTKCRLASTTTSSAVQAAAPGAAAAPTMQD